MDRSGQLVGQGRIDGALPGDPALARKNGRNDDHVEMAFATFPRAAMARVLSGLVGHIETLWGKGAL